MATILEFRVTEDNAAPNGKPVEGALGEIIIFPGVRIERHDTASEDRQVLPDSIEPSPGARTKSRA